MRLFHYGLMLFRSPNRGFALLTIKLDNVVSCKEETGHPESRKWPFGGTRQARG